MLRGRKEKQGGVQIYENEPHLFEHIWGPSSSPVVSCFEVMHSVFKITNLRFKEGIFTMSHIPSILSYVYFLCVAFPEERLCVLLCFGTPWWQSHLEILFKEFATCQHSASYPANQLVILSIEYKLNFVT